jgi:MoxR-like ATPase
MRIRVGYPDVAAEKQVLDRPSSLHPAEELSPVLAADDVLDLQGAVDKVRMEDSLLDYLLAIVSETRRSDLLSLGVSTRGAVALTRAAKALALVRDRRYCLPDDIKELSPIVLPHRITLSPGQHLRTRRFEETEQLIRDIVESIPVPL